MKFTLSWLKEFLDTNASVDEISARLTALGLEVEHVIDRSVQLAPFKVAEILEACPHPDATKLQVCRVNNGSETLQIVCGAPNARAGIKVILAPIGTTIPAHGLVIKASKIRGVDSHGMLCSAKELMVGDDESGIIELPSNAIPGAPYVTLAGLDDPVFEIAITPNRGDCLGVYGIARDLAASGLGTLKKLILPQVTVDSSKTISVTINTANCSIFTCRSFVGVTNCPSPDWMQKYLKAIGVKPISALVDITNYIAFTYGRPLHVYDQALLDGSVTIRESKEGEVFHALNGNRYTLSEGLTVVADHSKILALGGVIGSSDSSCSRTSTTILLESALFDPAAVAKAGRALQIDSDSRYRFERHTDEDFVETGLELASALILSICGGEAGTIISVGKTEPQRSIQFSMDKIATLGGLTVDEEKLHTILTALGFTLHGNHLTIPSWRHDIDCEAAIVEEVLRVIGYDALPLLPLPAAAQSTLPILSAQQRRIATSRRLLATRGLTETVTYSFMPTDKAVLFGGGSAALRLENPISVDLESMRPSLLPNLLDAANRNHARSFFDLALFEIGPEFFGNIPGEQRLMMSGIRTGKTAAKSYYHDARDIDVFDVKADCFALLAESGVPTDRVTINRGAPSWYHPGRSGVISLGGKNILAYFGEIHPVIQKTFDLKNPVYAFEIIASAMPVSKPKQGRKPAPDFSDFQATTRDFAFIVNNDVPVETLLRSARAADKELITNVALFDIYRGKGVDEDKKSVAISVTLQSKTRTLTDEDIEIACGKIVVDVMKATNGILRG